MNIKSATTPKYADATHTNINLVIDVDGLGVIPFTASASDTTTHGKFLHAEAMAGKYGAIAPFVAKVKTQAEIDAEGSALAKANLTQLRADIFPDMLSFLATLPGAPLSIKNASALAAAEKAKVRV